MHVKSQVILCSLFTHQEQKDTIINCAACGRIIALLFHSFEVALGPHPKDLTFFQTNETELIQHVFGGSEVNAQRTKNEPSSYKIQRFFPFLNDTLKSA